MIALSTFDTMQMWTGIILGMMGLVVTCTTIPLIRRLAARVELRERRFHQSHDRPVSRFGGVALALAFVAAAVVSTILLGGEPLFGFESWLLVVSALAIFAIGCKDDCSPIGAKAKLLCQVLIAAGVYFCGVQIEVLKNPLTGTDYPLGSWGLLATVVWLVSLTNLINLIDGIDGLAGGISLMLMGLLLYSSGETQSFAWMITATMAGALMGFLYFNFPPAKIYMGDGGAYLLGYLIGFLTIHNSQKGTVAAALIAPIFALALPILDVTLAIVRRGLTGLPIFRPDRRHIHHRLVKLGFSHRRTLLTLYALSLVFLTMAFGTFWAQGRLVPILIGGVFLILLMSVRTFGFIQDWFSVGKVVEHSLLVRKETRYAISLSHWLEMEGERCRTVAQLWSNYLFLVSKLGFRGIKILLADGEEGWICSGPHLQRHGDWYVRHEIRMGNMLAFEFYGNPSVISGSTFEYLTDLAAEAWIKALQRWHQVHAERIHFERGADAVAPGTCYSVPRPVHEVVVPVDSP